MNEQNNLEPQLWELVYGLLTPEEAAILRRQITSDPAVARRYAEIRLQADLVASAAKIEVPAANLEVPGTTAGKKRTGKSAAAAPVSNLATRSANSGNGSVASVRW